MTIGEKLLNLTIEYTAAIEAEEHYGHIPGNAGRDPKVIAADYEATLRQLMG